MPLLKQAGCRLYQKTLFFMLPVLPYRDPEILGSFADAAARLKEKNVRRILCCVDPFLRTHPLFEKLCSALDQEGIETVIFSEIRPNPTVQSAQAAACLYRKKKCGAMIALGGGSVIDLAKAAGAAVIHPRIPLEKMAGILKVLRPTPYLIAIPTTCGTGSEATLAAVLVDEKTSHKFAINDFPLIPDAAVLDAACIHTLPASLAAATGMDALCHAVEAYIGRSVSNETGAWAKEAVQLIYENIDACAAHESRQAEEKMLQASHLAGKAFTRSYVGYIHALSHALSGRYGLPHGRTNAVLMPIVLEAYGKHVHKPLAELALCARLGEADEGDAVLAARFIESIRCMNSQFGFDACIEEIDLKDLDLLASWAEKEANPLYPVPVLWTREKLRELLLEAAVGPLTSGTLRIQPASDRQPQSRSAR